MKNLRLLGIALMATLLSVGIASCGGSNDDPTNNVKPTPSDNPSPAPTPSPSGDNNLSKKLKKMSSSSQKYGKIADIQFTYNNNDGKLVQVKYHSLLEHGQPTTDINIVYQDDKIVIKGEFDHDETYPLSNGLITEAYDKEREETSKLAVSYDGSGYISSASKEGQNHKFTWSNGNMIEENYNGGDEITKIEYTDYQWPTGLIFYDDIRYTKFRDYWWYLGVGGYWGKRPKNLPKSFKSDDETAELKWTVSNNYPTMVEIQYYYHGKLDYECTVTFEWE